MINKLTKLESMEQRFVAWLDRIEDRLSIIEDAIKKDD